VYENSEQSFRNFRAKYSLANTWPPDIRQIIRYIGFLSLNGYSPSTVRAYISGISFKLKTRGNEEITKSFIITKMLGGCDRLYKTQAANNTRDFTKFAQYITPCLYLAL